MNNKHLKLSALLVFFVLYSITGCVSYVKPVDQSICAKKLPFIEDGKTTKEDISKNPELTIFKCKSKNERIWVYRVESYEGEKWLSYELVLVFDENELLKKHSLVKIW
jgi:hypothetical protein